MLGLANDKCGDGHALPSSPHKIKEIGRIGGILLGLGLWLKKVNLNFYGQNESLLSIYKGRGGWSTQNEAEENMKISKEPYTSTWLNYYNHTSQEPNGLMAYDPIFYLKNLSLKSPPPVSKKYTTNNILNQVGFTPI